MLVFLNYIHIYYKRLPQFGSRISTNIMGIY